MESKFRSVEKIGGTKSGFVSQTFRTSCYCEAPEHVLTINLFLEEYLPEKKLEPEIILHMVQNIEVICDPCTLSNNLFVKLWTKVIRYYQRFKACMKLFFTGYLEAEGCFIFQGEEHIQDVVDALIEGKESLSKSKEEWMERNRAKNE